MKDQYENHGIALLFFNHYSHKAYVLSFHFNTVWILFDFVFRSYLFELCRSSLQDDPCYPSETNSCLITTISGVIDSLHFLLLATINLSNRNISHFYVFAESWKEFDRGKSLIVSTRYIEAGSSLRKLPVISAGNRRPEVTGTLSLIVVAGGKNNTEKERREL